MEHLRRIMLLAITTVLLLDSNALAGSSNERPWFTIFIHGVLKPHLSFSELFGIANKTLTDGKYVRTTLALRDHPYVTQAHAMQGYGLRAIDINTVCQGCTAGAFSYLFASCDQQHKNSNQDRYYTFGWSGLLMAHERLNAAQKLYQALKKELSFMHDQQQRPKVRVVGFSHGGTVGLNLARCAANDTDQQPLEIDELILIGMPVHRETDHLVNNPLFKRVYHLYSMGDIAQKADIISGEYASSHRRFIGRKDFTLPKKLTQIELQVARPAPNIKTIKPGHTELWFFGWNGQRYRRNFPLCPLPVAGFTPLIINTLNALSGAPLSDVVVILDPENATMKVITPRIGKPKHQFEKPFLTIQKLNLLRKKIWEYCPPWHSRKYRHRIVKEAINSAIEQLHCSAWCNQ